MAPQSSPLAIAMLLLLLSALLLACNAASPAQSEDEGKFLDPDDIRYDLLKRLFKRQMQVGVWSNGRLKLPRLIKRLFAPYLNEEGWSDQNNLNRLETADWPELSALSLSDGRGRHEPASAQAFSPLAAAMKRTRMNASTRSSSTLCGLATAKQSQYTGCKESSYLRVQRGSPKLLLAGAGAMNSALQRDIGDMED